MENLDFEKKLEDILIKEQSVGLLTGRMGGGYVSITLL